MTEHESTLETVAETLMHDEPGYWGDFPKPFLMAWLNDRRNDHSVICAYCDLPLMSFESNSFRNGTVDHLLPKSKYESLEFVHSNAVPCCYRCNAVKGRWDPNNIEPVYLPESGALNAERRRKLIQRAREYVQGKLAQAHPNIWRCWAKASQQLVQAEGIGKLFPRSL
jgi:hypothetical protein